MVGSFRQKYNIKAMPLYCAWYHKLFIEAQSLHETKDKKNSGNQFLAETIGKINP